MNTRRDLILWLNVAVALSSLDPVECSKLKQARRSIENSDEPPESQRKWFPRRRLTLADDVFTSTEKEFELVGYHRAVGAAVAKTISMFFRGIGSLINFYTRKFRSSINAGLNLTIGLLQNMAKTVAIEDEAEPELSPTMSSIYDSISGTKSKQDPSTRRRHSTEAKTRTPTPSKQTGTQKATTNAAPLHKNKNLPKATSRGGTLGKKSIDFTKGGSSSSSFDSMNSAVSEQEHYDIAVPSTSFLAGLLPSLVAGIVFTTAGSMVGYLWNGEWTETASSVMDYFWGDETTTETFHDAATSSTTATNVQEHNDFDTFSAPITPDRR